MAVQTKSLWDIGEYRPGETGATDPGAMEETGIASAAISFGVFVAPGASNKLVDPVAASDTSVRGVAMIADYAGNYDTGAYITEDTVAVARRGYVWAKIDPADKPSPGDTVTISSAVGKEGWLVGTPATGVTLKITSGVRITQVLDNVAEVYLDGSAHFPLLVTP